MAVISGASSAASGLLIGGVAAAETASAAGVAVSAITAGSALTATGFAFGAIIFASFCPAILPFAIIGIESFGAGYELTESISAARKAALLQSCDYYDYNHYFFPETNNCLLNDLIYS